MPEDSAAPTETDGMSDPRYQWLGMCPSAKPIAVIEIAAIGTGETDGPVPTDTPAPTPTPTDADTAETTETATATEPATSTPGASGSGFGVLIAPVALVAALAGLRLEG